MAIENQGESKARVKGHKTSGYKISGRKVQGQVLRKVQGQILNLAPFDRRQLNVWASTTSESPPELASNLWNAVDSQPLSTRRNSMRVARIHKVHGATARITVRAKRFELQPAEGL